jgi:hypothetical protein
VWYQARTSRGIRSARGTAPPGGVQFQAGRHPGGQAQPPGDGTRLLRGSENARLTICPVSHGSGVPAGASCSSLADRLQFKRRTSGSTGERSP